MANAVPVNSEEVAVKAPKGASASISADVMAEIKAQVAAEMAALTHTAPVADADDTFKKKGGVKLQSHEATRQDF